jgi:hypothetical protein
LETVAMVATNDGHGVGECALVVQTAKQFADDFVGLPVGSLEALRKAFGVVSADAAVFDVADQLPEEDREGPRVGHALRLGDDRCRVG